MPYSEGMEDRSSPLKLIEDTRRQRLIVVQGTTLRISDAPTGRPLYERKTSSPTGMLAIEPQHGEMWLCLPESGELLVISPSNRLLATIADLGRPTSLLATKKTYLCDRSSGTSSDCPR